MAGGVERKFDAQRSAAAGGGAGNQLTATGPCSKLREMGFPAALCCQLDKPALPKTVSIHSLMAERRGVSQRYFLLHTPARDSSARDIAPA